MTGRRPPALQMESIDGDVFEPEAEDCVAVLNAAQDLLQQEAASGGLCDRARLEQRLCEILGRSELPQVPQLETLFEEYTRNAQHAEAAQGAGELEKLKLRLHSCERLLHHTVTQLVAALDRICELESGERATSRNYSWEMMDALSPVEKAEAEQQAARQPACNCKLVCRCGARKRTMSTHSLRFDEGCCGGNITLERVDGQPIIATRHVPILGDAACTLSRPFMCTGVSSIGFTLTIIRQGFCAGYLRCGFTATPPDFSRSATSRITSLPNSWIADFAKKQLIQDGRPTSLFSSGRNLQQGDEVSFVITANRTIQVIVNGQRVLNYVAEIPADTPLFGVVEVLGHTESVKVSELHATIPETAADLLVLGRQESLL